MSFERPICEECGKPIEDLRRKHFCSDKCSEQAAEAEAAAEEAKWPVKSCPHCGKEFRSKWSYCSAACRKDAWQSRKAGNLSSSAPSAQSPPSPPPPMPDADQAVNVEPEILEGAPALATCARLRAVLTHIAEGLTEKQACGVVKDVKYDTWLRWKKMNKVFPSLQAQAEGLRILALLKRKQWLVENKLDWKEAGWELERRFPQFVDPARAAAIQINQINGNGNRNPLAFSQTELEEAWARLKEVDQRVRERRERERDKSREETKPSRVIEVDSQIGYTPLALDYPTQAERPAPGTAMRASDYDPESGQRRKPPVDAQIKRQYELEQQRRSGHDDGSGKQPF